MLKEKMAVEVIYDDKQEKILSYLQIDPRTLSKQFNKNNKNDFVWVQYDNDYSKRRILNNTQILTNF